MNFLFEVIYHHTVQSHPLEEATESRLEEGKGLDRNRASVNRMQVRSCPKQSPGTAMLPDLNFQPWTHPHTHVALYGYGRGLAPLTPGFTLNSQLLSYECHGNGSPCPSSSCPKPAGPCTCGKSGARGEAVQEPRRFTASPVSPESSQHHGKPGLSEPTPSGLTREPAAAHRPSHGRPRAGDIRGALSL